MFDVWNAMELDDYYAPHYYQGPLRFTDTVERVLQSVFHTITVIAIYEIVKEAFRKVEILKLRRKVQWMESLAHDCCLYAYGCKACECCLRLNTPTITYRFVPSSIYRALGAKTVLWKKAESACCQGYLAAKGRTSQEELAYLSEYLDYLTGYIREIAAEQDYRIRETLRKCDMERMRDRMKSVATPMRDDRPCLYSANYDYSSKNQRSPYNVCDDRQASTSKQYNPFDDPQPSTSRSQWHYDPCADPQPSTSKMGRSYNPCHDFQSI